MQSTKIFRAAVSAAVALCFLAGESISAEKKYGGVSLDQWRKRLVDFDADSPQAAHAVPALIEMVKDRQLDNITRRHAALALGRIGAPARTAVGTLVACLDEEGKDKEATALWAAKALALLGPAARSAAPKLIGILQDVQQPGRLRMATLEALARIGEAHPDAMPALLELLQQRPRTASNPPHTPLREVAVDVLSIAGSHAAVATPLLARIVANPDETESIRRRAAGTLAAIGPPARVAEASLVEALVLDDSQAVRDAAAAALGRLGPAIVPRLQTLLRHPQADVRWRAAFALGQMGPPANAASEDLQRAAGDENPVVQISAVEAQWKIHGSADELIDKTIDLMTHQQRPIRFRALTLFDQFGPSALAGTTRLRQLQQDRRAYVRQIATKALAKLEE